MAMYDQEAIEGDGSAFYRVTGLLTQGSNTGSGHALAIPLHMRLNPNIWSVISKYISFYTYQIVMLHSLLKK